MKPWIQRTVLCVCWLLVIGAGFAAISRYQQNAGVAGATPASWPVQSTVQPDGQRNTLIFFAHPQCPCTRASLEEFNRLLAKCSGKVSVHAFFVKPSGASNDWSQSDLWRATANIPVVQVHEDIDGNEAKLFGAETSGYVVLYNPAGQLLFKGGITSSRGHAGDNAGEKALLALISNQKPQLNETPVYGCSLFGVCKMNVKSKAE